MGRPRSPSAVFFVMAYLFLAAADFICFLYSHRSSHGLGARAFVLLAVGWNW